MTLTHEIKLADVIFNVTRTNKDGSIMIDAGGFPARYIPGREKIILTNNKGRIASIQLNKVKR